MASTKTTHTDNERISTLHTTNGAQIASGQAGEVCRQVNDRGSLPLI
uniref:Uncharacterized protein n=1 Tax=Arundo donax TaxID=35708 RepID=A0A0A9BJI7_ARUDO